MWVANRIRDRLFFECDMVILINTVSANEIASMVVIEMLPTGILYL